MIYLLNIIQHNIKINYTITGRQKRGQNSKKTNKQTIKNTKVQQINNN